MSRFIRLCALILALSPIFSSQAGAQSGGSRAGAGGISGDEGGLALLDREIAQRYITIEGSAEVRIAPTEIRVVMAVTSTGKTPQECRQEVENTIKSVKAEWARLGIPADKIVVDFISMLPRYEWSVEKRGDKEMAIEQKVGYRLQANLHLAVAKEATAQAAVSKAIEKGVTDIIAFDYWSGDLDEAKANARALAIKAVRSKADTLLALFEPRPPVINVQERASVRYPESLYHSFTNSEEESLTSDHLRRELPQVRAARPKNTYYRGLYWDGDVQGRELPMNPQISVISTVRLYFESPAAKEEKSKTARRD